MPGESAIVQKLRKLRHQPVRLILHTAGNPRDHLSEIEGAGLQVHHIFRLIKAVSVEGPASAALRLADRDWVRKIEEDREVHTQSPSPRGGGER